MDNANSIDYLEKIKIQVIENLKKTTFAPSVQMQDVPRDALGGMTEEEEAELDDLDDDENKDVRSTQRKLDIRTGRDDEFDDSDDEEDNDYGIHKANGERKSRNIMNYQMAVNEASDVDMDSGVQSPQAGNYVDEPASAMVTEANAEVNAEVMEKKQLDATAAMIGEVGPSNAASRAESIKQPAAIDNDGDVEMTEEPISTQPEVPSIAAAPTERATPPISPISAAPTPPKAPTVDPPAEPVNTEAPPEAAVVKQEGEAERNDEDVKAEASTVIAEQSQP